MEGIQEKLLLYHRLFLVFFILFLLCLALSIAVFFLLRIPEVLGYLTGWRARRSIRRLEEENGGPELPGYEEYMAEEAWDGELTALLQEAAGNSSRPQGLGRTDAELRQHRSV